MTTRTAALSPNPSLIDQFIFALANSGRRLAQLVRMPAPGVPETTAVLLRLAARHEGSRPRYAADLRAAASMQDRDEER